MQSRLREALESAAHVSVRSDRTAAVATEMSIARLRAQVYALFRELPEEMSVRELLEEFEPGDGDE